jgi:hypothetical protein
MKELLSKLFATTRKPRHVGPAFRPTLESLEGREVPSGGPWFGGGHDLALFNHAQFGPAFAGATGGGNDAQVGPAFAGALGGRNDPGDGFAGFGIPTLAANLTGASGTSGTATFSTNALIGQNSFHLHASGLTANTTYTVSSGSTTLGTFTTDANGQGKLSVSNVSPALTAGSTITVKDPTGATALSGTLANTNLFATLGGTSGVDGIAFYHANVTAGTNSLQVGLFGLSANSTYTVQLGGKTVGTVTTNAFGAGHLSVSDLSTPPTAGSALTVLDSTGATVLQGSFTASLFSFFGGWFPH